jgi:predicted nucleic acid-binding Zn ribbon protein
LTKFKSQGLTPDQLACGAWKQAVGKRLAERTRAAALVRQTLVVEVEDAVWQRQLHSLRHQILANLGRVLGPDFVTAIEFRIGIPRRAPQREMVSTAGGDEAARITDPVLRRLYLESKRQSQA